MNAEMTDQERFETAAKYKWQCANGANATRFQKRHYCELAKIISRLPQPTRHDAAVHLAAAFRKDNPRFSPALWLQESGARHAS